MRNNFPKTGILFRFYLRKDWLLLAIWWLVIGGLNLIVGVIYNRMYGTDQNIRSIARTLQTTAMASMFGSLPSAQKYTTFDIAVGEMLIFTIIMLFIMNIQLVIKNTRGEEDNGVTELIRGLAIGKLAQSSAVLFETVMVTALIAMTGFAYLNLAGATLEAVGLFVSLLFIGGCLASTLSLLVAQIAGSAQKMSHHTLQFTTSGTVEIKTNTLAWQHIVDELMLNAEKYSPDQSTITIQFMVEKTDIVLQVADQGVGIKASEREKVFQRLYRIDESRSQQVPGTGLGLSIVESYVQRLNGIVEISDNQPQGTIFTVRIPKPIEE